MTKDGLPQYTRKQSEERDITKAEREKSANQLNKESGL